MFMNQYSAPDQNYQLDTIQPVALFELDKKLVGKSQKGIKGAYEVWRRRA
jgi:hypothetical protein